MAYDFYENKDYDNTLRICLDLYDKNIKLDKVLPLLIYSYLSKGEFYNIYDYFEKYTQLNLKKVDIDKFLKESFSIYDNLDLNEFALNLYKAQFLIKFERFSEALNYLNKVIIENPNNTEVLNLKGFALLKLKRYKESYDIFNRVISIDEINYYAWKFKAQILFVNDYDKKAMDAFFKVLSINNSELFIWREYISSCIFSKEYEKAIAECKRALEIFPDNLDLLIDLFEIYLFLEDYDNSKIIADKIADCHIDTVDEYLEGKNNSLNEDILSFIIDSKPYTKKDSLDKFILDDVSFENHFENNQLNDDEMDDIITKVLDSLDDGNNNIKFLFKKDR